MNMRALVAPFSVTKPVSTSLHVHKRERPTIVALVLTPHNHVLLVLPREAELHGWILPQGGIDYKESPAMALLRELREECGFQADAIDASSVTALHREVVPTRAANKPDKEMYVVGVRLCSKQRPQLNNENRHFMFAGGPNCIWSHTSDCRPEKRQLIARALQAAVYREFLTGPRWAKERLHPFCTHA